MYICPYVYYLHVHASYIPRYLHYFTYITYLGEVSTYIAYSEYATDATCVHDLTCLLTYF